ncbi:MAG: ABC transporter permease [Saprospiraceae bacterium]|nr:ABC transporter permease [Saprospiraceae bacterium]
MNRLWQIEWWKLKNYRPFWILVIMYIVVVILITCGGGLFLQFLKKQGADFNGIDPTLIPLYDFPDIWQNMTYLGSFCKVILGFIVVISVANEESFRTLRQNIIDGLSKQEFLWSKLLLILGLSVGATILMFLCALLMGSLYSSSGGMQQVFQSMDFIWAYFLILLTYLCFCFWVTLLLPRTGLVIVGLFLYTIIFEPFFALFLENFPYISDFIRPSTAFFPVRSLYNLIPVPFSKFLLREFQEFVSLKETMIVIGWLGVNLFLCRLILHRKDW